jgi:cytochrome oxidase Cu insertion factor (SCO1/SenC/PrrC family)
VNAAGTGAPEGSPPRRSLLAPLALFAALVLLAVVAIRRAAGPDADEATAAAIEERGRKLPDYFDVEDFSLVDQDGRPFTKAGLAGRITIVDFFFTGCPGPCIALTSKMRSLVATLGSEPDLQFLSISVDPQADTPDALRRYAATQGANFPRWRFLTGKPEEVRRVCAAFKAALGEKLPSGDISHSTYLYVVDRRQRLRGIHDTQMAEEWKPAVLHTVRRLLEQQPREAQAPPPAEPPPAETRGG